MAEARGGVHARQWLIVALVLLTLALAADAVAWAWIEHRLRHGVDDWRSAMAAAGWHVETGQMVRGGWPVEASLTMSNMVVRGGDAAFPGGLVWTADTATLILSPARPHALRLSMSGPQTVRVAGLPPLDIYAAEMTADLSDHADVAVRDLRIELAGAPPGNPPVGTELRIRALRMHVSRPQPRLTAFAVDMADLALPSVFGWPLGGTVGIATATGELQGDVPSGVGVRDRLAAWRDDDGALRLGAVSLTWGPLVVNGNGRLALDQALQPAGEGTVRLGGWSEALDRLVQGDAMPSREARTARAVLSLLAGGGTDEVSLPITLRNRTVSTRSLPIARLPILDWPAP